MLHRNIRIEEDLIHQLFNSIEKRLARVLLLRAGYGQQDKPDQVVANTSHTALATAVGTTRARVSVLLKKFQRQGFIEVGAGGMSINSCLLSVVLHD